MFQMEISSNGESFLHVVKIIVTPPVPIPDKKRKLT